MFLSLFCLQEYCIRHLDGSPVNSDAERQRLIQCLEAAIERRVCEVSCAGFILRTSIRSVNLVSAKPDMIVPTDQCSVSTIESCSFDTNQEGIPLRLILGKKKIQTWGLMAFVWLVVCFQLIVLCQCFRA